MGSQMSPSPKAFISHASGDAAFVQKLATDLRLNGVDVWYSGWEMRPGDSIPEKVDEGLGACEIFIIVLSHLSISRRWVHTELDAATVRKLDGKIRKIIPIKIDDCGELPPILGSLLLEDFSAEPYETALNRVLDSIFVVETKAPRRIAPAPTRGTKSRAHSRVSSSAVAGILAGIFGVLLLLVVGMLPLLGNLVPGGLSVALIGLSFWLIVAGFFSWVESLLNQDTKAEVACWLVEVRIGQKVEPWPQTFVEMFDRVFGSDHWSRDCLLKSIAASLFSGILGFVVATLMRAPDKIADQYLSVVLAFSGATSPVFMLFCALPDYLSLLETRWMLAGISKTKRVSKWVSLLALDAIVSMSIAFFQIALFAYIFRRPLTDIIFNSTVLPCFLIPAFFASIWLWLYAGSGFLLKFARRFDIGFQWFNRKFDIEKKPLQAIGLVAGALVAIVYWGVAIVSRII